jgi:CBS domain-containing protein
MQDAVFTCGPKADALSVSRMMTKWNVGSLPVMDENRTLLGLVSEYDLLQALIDGRDLGKLAAADVMVKPVVTVTEETTLVQVATLFQDRYLTRVPVVRGDKLVGIVARRDLLSGHLKASQYWS